MTIRKEEVERYCPGHNEDHHDASRSRQSLGTNLKPKFEYEAGAPRSSATLKFVPIICIAVLLQNKEAPAALSVRAELCAGQRRPRCLLDKLNCAAYLASN